MIRAPKVTPSVRSGVSPFYVMDMFATANTLEEAGHEIFHLEAGQPCHGAPKAAIAAMKRGLDEDLLGYTNAIGTNQLREAIAAFYDQYHGLEVSPSRIVVTMGSSCAFLLAFIAAFDPGQTIGLPVPYYPAYPNIVRSQGLVPAFLRLDHDSHYHMTPDHLVDGLDGLMLANPANPTGSMLGADQFYALLDAAAERGITFISDEIYHGLTFDGARAPTALAHSDQAIVINSFSKYFCMTGWRLGWMVLPEALVRPVERLAQNLFVAPPSPAQYAAIAALQSTEELDGLVAGYSRARDILVAGLKDVGITRIAPVEGAFYMYADVSHLTADSRAFCMTLLEETGIATAPGIDFDAEEGHRFIRLCFARGPDVMTAAVKRLKTWMQARP